MKSHLGSEASSFAQLTRSTRIVLAALLATSCTIAERPMTASRSVEPMEGVGDIHAMQAALGQRLGTPDRFLIGLGNDVTAEEGWDSNRAHAWELGHELDIHYLYLSGLDWPSWTPGNGGYVTAHANAAKAHGVTPMFTLYQAAAWGEDKLEAFADLAFMAQYWRGVRTMYERLGELDGPSMVHLEPDLWGYFERRGEVPSAVTVQVAALVPECAELPDDVSGFGRCLVKLGRELSPQTSIAFSASSFGAFTNTKSDPVKIASYLNSVGAMDTDFMVVETLDRDAGCFERGEDPLCKRSGKFYWGDHEYRDHLAWAKTIHDMTGKMLLWWQMPLGVPSDEFGSSGAYRDNRVEWLFTHTTEFVAAGGFGAVFGTGAPHQTSAKTDGGQFARAVQRYYASPVWY